LPFDEEAIRALRAIQPFPSPPAEIVDPITTTFTFTFGFETPATEPPSYMGDALGHSPDTSRFAVASSLDWARHSTPLNGSTPIAGAATYDRVTAATMVSYDARPVGVLELQVPFGTIQYQDEATGATARASGVGDISLHLHRRGRWGWRWIGSYFLGVE